MDYREGRPGRRIALTIAIDLVRDLAPTMCGLRHSGYG